MGPASGPESAEEHPLPRGHPPWAPQVLPGSRGRKTKAGEGRRAWLAPGVRPQKRPRCSPFSSAAAGPQRPAKPWPHGLSAHCCALRSNDRGRRRGEGPRLTDSEFQACQSHLPPGATSPRPFSPPENEVGAPSALVVPEIKASGKPGPAAVLGETGGTRLDKGPWLALAGRLSLSARTPVW